VAIECAIILGPSLTPWTLEGFAFPDGQYAIDVAYAMVTFFAGNVVVGEIVATMSGACMRGASRPRMLFVPVVDSDGDRTISISDTDTDVKVSNDKSCHPFILHSNSSIIFVFFGVSLARRQERDDCLLLTRHRRSNIVTSESCS
jgi:hypothetical protein